jgi:capsid assembly protease
MLLSNLAGRLLGTPLLLSRPKLDTLIAVLGDRIGGQAPILAGQAAFEPIPKPSSARLGAIAVIPVFGTLVRRTMGLEAASGLTSYSELATQLRSAAADTSVRGILLELDSPGGEAGGVFELAQLVRQITQEKPVWAIAADSAFSAAYAIASAATRVIVTPTSGVGSIGVIAMHVDQSARDAQQGFRYTPISAGAHKADLSPHTPAQPEALARLQREVDRLYGLFVEHLAGMRSVSANAIRETEADLYFAEAAVNSGLADAVLGVDDTLSDFASFLTTPNRPRTNTTQLLLPTPTPQASQEPIMQLESPSPASFNTEQSPSGPNDPPENSVAIEIPDEEPAPNASTAVASVAATAKPAAMSYVDAAQIAEMCALANKTERTHGFLLKGFSVAQARTALLQEMAAGEEIASVLPPFSARTQASSVASAAGASASSVANSNPLLAAVSKLGKL